MDPNSVVEINAAVEGWLVDVGVPEMAAGFGVRVVWLAAVLVLAWVADWIAKHVLLRLVSHAIEKSKTKLDNILLEKKVFTRLSHIASGLVIYLTAPIVFAGYARTISTSCSVASWPSDVVKTIA